MTSAKAPCATCGKARSVGTCDGCKQKFCESHFTAHRNSLKQQLEAIGEQHNNFINNLIENEYTYKPLFDQIDLWETEAINRIQSAANEVRQQIETLCSENKGELSK